MFKSIILALAIVFSISYSLLSQEPQKPNIVLILADDMGWGDLQVTGNQIVETPNIDRLAKESFSFERFYVCPLCAPTRSEMLTGRYFLRTGVSSVTSGNENMRTDETTLAEILKSNGYTTGCFGKWHNGAYYQQHPNCQGFDEFVGFCVGHLGYYFDAIYQHNDEDIKSSGYSTDFFTDKALEFIDSNKSKPFFCYIPYNVPHSPFQVPEQYFKKYKSKDQNDELATIYGMVDNMDENVGRILSKLQQLNLTENTIVIFLSDNGPNTYRYNGEMKGKKGSVDEGGVRVPFYISWPKKIKAGTTTQLAQDIDILPTIMGLCNLPYQTNFPIDGKNLSRIIRKNEQPYDRYIFSRQANSVLQNCDGSVRNDRYRLVVTRKDTLLYDLINDPSQKVDISQNEILETKQLASAYKKWEKDLVDNYEPQTTINAGFVGEKRIVLPVQDAISSGKVQYSSIHPNQSHTQNWVQQGDSIFWNLNMQQSGKYRVELEYGCLENELGSRFVLQSKAESLEFTINKAFDSIVLPNRDYVPRAESVERTWDWMPVGNLSLAAGEERIVLKMIQLKNHDAGLIKAIRLVHQ